MLDGGLRRKDRSEYVDIENPVELFFSHRLDWRELINARVIDQDVNPTVILYRCIDDGLCIRSLGNITLDRDGSTTRFGDGSDNIVSPRFTGRIIYDYRRAFRRQCLHDSRSDAFGRPGNDCHLTCESTHVYS